VARRGVAAVTLDIDPGPPPVVTLDDGAFGRNISDQALLLAPMAARLAGAPVKFVKTRRVTFTLMSHRAQARQRLRLGADADGRLSAIAVPGDGACHVDCGRARWCEWRWPRWVRGC